MQAGGGGHHYHPTGCTMRILQRPLALLITAILFFSALPQASHSLAAADSQKQAEELLISRLEVHHSQHGGTSSSSNHGDIAPRRRMLSKPAAAEYLQKQHHSSSSSHGVKVDLQRIDMPCEAEPTEVSGGGGGHKDHQRLRCAVQRSSLRAQALRKGGHVHGGPSAGSKTGGDNPTGGTTAGMQAFDIDES